METLLYSLCAAAGWTASVYIVRLQYRHPSQARLAICAAFIAFSTGITIAVPPLSAAIDDATGLPNLAKVLAHGCAMTITACAEIMLLFLALPAGQARTRGRRWVWLTATTYVVMVALFLVTLGHHPPLRLTVEYARYPVVAAYLALFVFVGFVTYCIDISRLCWRFASVCGRPWLRRGLRVTAAGAGCALLYCANKLTYLGWYALGGHPRGESRIAAVLVTVSALLMLTGLTLPAWGPALPAAPAWWQLRAIRRLDPLWRDLTAALPELELDPGLRRPLGVLRACDYALTRRFTEILDGRLALRGHLHPAVSAAADRHAERAGLTGEDRQVIVEAAQLAFAVRAHAAGAAAVRPDPPQLYHPTGGYPAEVAWLVRVADAYRRSPLVAAALAEVPPPGAGVAATTGATG